jgi:hypothetical protein
MPRVLTCLLLAVVLGGCFASRPPDNVGFGRTSTLRDLEGTYQNRGETGEGEPPIYLSEMIPAWASGMRDTVRIDHSSISTIQVHAVGDTALRVVAFGDAGVLREQTFVNGRDFDFNGGRIHLRHVLEAVHDPDHMFVGVRYSSVQLGVDKKGQGKAAQATTGAALAGYFIPIVGHGSGQVRFVRIESR